jgi:hypothetical protein
MRCRICQIEFTPSKYRPCQQVCFKVECQRLRQIQNNREWRSRNPDYFLSSGQSLYWRKKRQDYTEIWRQKNKAKLKKYALKNADKRRLYMREYMRKRRRLQQSVNQGNI